MPIRSLLIGVRCTQDAAIVKEPSSELEPDRQTIRIEPTRDRNGGLPAKVERNGEAWPTCYLVRELLQHAAGFIHPWGDGIARWHEQQIDLLKNVLKLHAQSAE